MSSLLEGTSPVHDPAAAYFAGSGRRQQRPRAEPEETPDDRHARLAAAEKAASQHGADAAPDNVVAPCPYKERHSIEVLVIGPDDAPVENVAVVLEKSETEVLVAKTDAAGHVCFRGLLEQGRYRLYPRELDRDAWELEALEKLPPERDLCKGDAAWKAPSGAGSKGPITHVVREGECISTLAYRYGLLPDTLWNADENAALKKLRGDKNILNPGDSVVIPVPRREAKQVEAGKAYRIRGKGFAETVRVRFLDPEGQPRAKQPYVIALVSDAMTEERAGETNGEGFVIEPAAASVHTVKITLGKGETHEFRVACLAPLDTIAGVQARLCHLGYTCGDEDGELGPWTRRALRDFQRDFNLPVTSEPDDATRKQLRAESLV